MNDFSVFISIVATFQPKGRPSASKLYSTYLQIALVLQEQMHTLLISVPAFYKIPNDLLGKVQRTVMCGNIRP